MSVVLDPPATLVRPGMRVRSSDGETLGTVEGRDHDAFIVTRGHLFKRRFRGQLDRVTAIVDGDVIYRRRDPPLYEGDEPAEPEIVFGVPEPLRYTIVPGPPTND
jgi:hypothetical protein